MVPAPLPVFFAAAMPANPFNNQTDYGIGIGLRVPQHRQHHIHPGMIQRRFQLHQRRRRQSRRNPRPGLPRPDRIRTQHLLRHIPARGQPLPQIRRRRLAPLIQGPVMVGRQRIVPGRFGMAGEDEAFHVWNVPM